MKIGIMQPYIFPYIGYFQLINAVDKFIIYDDVQFIKGGWINRNYILLQHEKHLFNLLLNGASANKLINEIAVNSNQLKLLKTIENCYRKAPYFDTVYPVINRILNYNDNNLAKYVGSSILEIAIYLNINTEIVYSSDLKKDNTLKAQEKVIDICKLLNADTYINSIGGLELYNKFDFEENNISLLFISSKNINYKQFNDDFISSLSIIDVLMFNSIEEIREMLNQYSLI